MNYEYSLILNISLPIPMFTLKSTIRHPAFWKLLAAVLFLSGCAPVTVVPDSKPEQTFHSPLPAMDYSIQVGAFSVLNNAVRLMGKMQDLGIEAYYFKDRDSLFKVRFGNYPDYPAAEKQARSLRQKGYIQDYHIVRPESYTAAQKPGPSSLVLRNRLVNTARGFLGIPYRWGGQSRATGFDCSGLTMTVYRQNGLNLPRVSRHQFRSGRRISIAALDRGDLVFFATDGSGQVSHVGIYIGRGQFIHAPAEGKNVRTESLAHPYYSARLVGARTYL
ncbi:MAG: NlpC/P60 family protein [Desulfonatronovibrionaceae bacterium]